MKSIIATFRIEKQLLEKFDISSIQKRGKVSCLKFAHRLKHADECLSVTDAFNAMDLVHHKVRHVR